MTAALSAAKRGGAVQLLMLEGQLRHTKVHVQQLQNHQEVIKQQKAFEVERLRRLAAAQDCKMREQAAKMRQLEMQVLSPPLLWSTTFAIMRTFSICRCSPLRSHSAGVLCSPTAASRTLAGAPNAAPQSNRVHRAAACT